MTTGIRFRVYSMPVDAPAWQGITDRCEHELRASIMSLMDSLLLRMDPDDGLSSLVADMIREDHFGGVESIDYFGEDD